MNYIRNYVALQKARKEESVIIDLHIGENLAGFSIAPLLFIAFIENSFKYVGSNGDMEHRVFISLMKAGNTFYFNCRNTKEMNIAVNGDHKGIGVANAQRRLQLLYPKTHELEITNSADYYEVNLKIRLA